MKTLLPYSSFSLSASVLTDEHLANQRIETMTIMNALRGAGGWTNHPGVHMWAHYEDALLMYQEAVIYEWTQVRGYTDTCWGKTVVIFGEGLFSVNVLSPWWLGNEDLHMSHQSNLLRQFPEHYSQYFPDVSPDMPYYWPTEQLVPYG